MDGLKQRIVGALVLISLAVIFVPMLFDEPHTERTTQKIKLPEEPAFPSVDIQGQVGQQSASSGDQEASQDSAPAYTIEEPKAAAPTVATPSEGSAPTAEQETAPAPAPAPEPAPKPQPAPSGNTAKAAANAATPSEPEPTEDAEYKQTMKGAWLVQLGSFGNEKNALRLRDEVRDKGYAAYTENVKRGDITLTRVFSGPFVSEDEAKSAKSRLDKAFNLNSLVMSGDR
ncbi:sporulation protein [Marinobacter halodurans]|uniref:Sporulation protein n=1 Tax=Marinobacter halodurans TaxID=2528979 RepID=A0ABY1ZLX1_9GAMM|nr:SPOR domain-containing protein [Marinobacter halodurans]TBW54752.1 sporulation protein [Marinobacter halodurans]